MENHIKWKGKSKIYLKGCGRTLSWRKCCTTAALVLWNAWLRACVCVALHCLAFLCVVTPTCGAPAAFWLWFLAQRHSWSSHQCMIMWWPRLATPNATAAILWFARRVREGEFSRNANATLEPHSKTGKQAKYFDIFVNEFYIENMGVSKFGSSAAEGATDLCGCAHMRTAYNFKTINCFTPTAVAEEVIGEFAVFSEVKVIIAGSKKSMNKWKKRTFEVFKTLKIYIIWA